MNAWPYTKCLGGTRSFQHYRPSCRTLIVSHCWHRITLKSLCYLSITEMKRISIGRLGMSIFWKSPGIPGPWHFGRFRCHVGPIRSIIYTDFLEEHWRPVHYDLGTGVTVVTYLSAGIIIFIVVSLFVYWLIVLSDTLALNIFWILWNSLEIPSWSLTPFWLFWYFCRSFCFSCRFQFNYLFTVARKITVIILGCVGDFR